MRYVLYHPGMALLMDPGSSWTILSWRAVPKTKTTTGHAYHATPQAGGQRTLGQPTDLAAGRWRK